MAKKRKSRFDGKSLWSAKPKIMTADKDLETILGTVRKLPLRYWKERMFFSGARDDELFRLTGERFPAKLEKDHTHPVFSLRALPENTGFRVCPCSSRRPFRKKTHYRHIKKGCRLLHTGHVMDRDSYLVEAVRFNIPSSLSSHLRFRGEAPENCIRLSNENSRLS